MNRTHTGIKRYLTALAVLLLGIIVAISAIGLSPMTAKADSADFSEPAAITLSISNTQFADTNGATPAEPNNWTGAALSGASSSKVVSGVVSLVPEEYNEAIKEDDVYKLKRYKEYEHAVPQTPFGTNVYKDTNKKVLMINTTDSETAYGYTSDSVTFAAGGYYRVSAYVKTGSFSESTGAAIKLTGLPEDLYFRNINTVSNLEKDASGLPVLNDKNLYGFKKYTFYVAAPLLSDSTVTLSLQVGDITGGDENYRRPAQGYAFFDNIEAKRISANVYSLETSAAQNRDNIIIKDFNSDINYLTDSGDISYLYGDDEDGGTEIGSFNNIGANGLPLGWTRINDVENAQGGAGRGFVYDAGGTFVEDNEWKLTSRPMSPVGNQDGNSNILFLHSNEKVAFGYYTPTYTVLRNTFYRISYFVKTENIEGGSGATAVLRGTNGVASNENKLTVSSSMLTGDSSNEMRYGWKQQSFYIKGSVLRDYEFRLELWLGQPSSLSSGTAMFDEVRIQKLTPAEYSSNCSSGTIVTFDPTFTDTGVTNGNFYEVGEYEEYKYPLVPASWTKITPDKAETTGFDDSEVKTAADVVSGIISTESAHFDANRENYNNAVNPAPGKANLLMISSLENTAIAYRSPTVTVEAEKSYRFTASLNTEAVNGYGANLVLKVGNNVIATIEQIKGGSGFKTYTFYIEGGKSSQSVSMEIWLGMNDRIDNTTKLASGTMFADKVAFEELTDGNYSTYSSSYDTQRSIGVKNLSFAAYSFDRLNMSAYDYYSSDVVKTPYNWTLSLGDESNVVYGIFDSTTLPAENRTEIPAKFVNSDTENNGVLYLRNIAPGYSAISTNNAISLSENSYYLVQVSIKVDVTEETRNDDNIIGAGIVLSNNLEKDYAFKNIKDTSVQSDADNPDSADYEAFRTYSFYIKTTDSTDIGLAITLGDTLLPNKHCSGRVYVNNIKVTEINNVDYETAVENLDDDEQYIMNADLSAADEDDDTDNNDETESEIAWWLIPSILFAVALLIAVIGTFVRKLLERRAEKKSIQVKNSYDRKATLHKIHNDKESGETVNAEIEDDYDEFDDALSPAPAKAKKAARKAEEEPVENEVEDEFDEFDDDKPAEEEAEEPVESDEETDTAAENGESASEGGAEESGEKAESGDDEKVEEKASDKPEKKVKKVKKDGKSAPARKSGDAYTDEFED